LRFLGSPLGKEGVGWDAQATSLQVPRRSINFCAAGAVRSFSGRMLLCGGEFEGAVCSKGVPVLPDLAYFPVGQSRVCQVGGERSLDWEDFKIRSGVELTKSGKCVSLESCKEYGTQDSTYVEDI